MRDRGCRGGEVVAVSAAGSNVVFIKEKFRRDGSRGSVLAGSTATLINERLGTRRTLTAPGCPEITGAMFGGPWLGVSCAGSDAPFSALYDLATRSWTPIAFDDAGPALLCGRRDSDPPSYCRIAGLGRYWIEIEVVGYGDNSYLLEPIPSGPVKTIDQVTAGGRRAFDLNTRTGIRRLCSPLRYPSSETIDGGRGPGWIQPLGPFALGADNTALDGENYAGAFLGRCGTKSRIKFPPDSGVVATTHDIAWWTPGAVRGIRLPSLRRFRITQPADALLEQPRFPLALSSSHVYIIVAGGLWGAPLHS